MVQTGGSHSSKPWRPQVSKEDINTNIKINRKTMKHEQGKKQKPNIDLLISVDLDCLSYLYAIFFSA